MDMKIGVSSGPPYSTYGLLTTDTSSSTSSSTTTSDSSDTVAYFVGLRRHTRVCLARTKILLILK